MKVLIVDDDPSLRFILSALVSRRGHEVTACESAEEAWDAWQRDQHELAILDWMLPGVDGIALARRIREAGGSWVVILLITGRDRPEDLLAALDAGIDDYLPKPAPAAVLDVRIAVAERRAAQRAKMRELQRAVEENRAREIQFEREIQRKLLLGRVPEGGRGLDVAASTSPALELGGDFYDFEGEPEGLFDVVIGDVMGKGIPAALQGAAIRAELPRLRTGGAGLLIEQLVALEKRIGPELASLSSYVALAWVRLDRRAGSLEYVNCGHVSPLRVSADGVHPLKSQCGPLGLLPLVEAQSDRLAIAPGDVIVLASDGVTEAAVSPGAEQYGIERLGARVAANRNRSAAEILAAVTEEVEQFLGGRPAGDDVTLVIVKVLAER